ncbi:hypothetical protein AB1M95_03645 [Sulfitobacter sp. LCG007]
MSHHILASDDFRNVLKTSTQPLHEALDSRMAALDIRDLDARRVFSEIMCTGYSRLGRACGWNAAEATPVLRDLVRALSEAGEQPSPAVPADATLAADAVAYVVLGSQFGLRYLRGRLPAQDRTGIFACEPDTLAWRDFQSRMTSRPPAASLRERIISDAMHAFEIFLSEAQSRIRKVSLCA